MGAEPRNRGFDFPAIALGTYCCSALALSSNGQKAQGLPTNQPRHSCGPGPALPCALTSLCKGGRSSPVLSRCAYLPGQWADPCRAWPGLASMGEACGDMAQRLKAALIVEVCAGPSMSATET